MVKRGMSERNRSRGRPPARARLGPGGRAKPQKSRPAKPAGRGGGGAIWLYGVHAVLAALGNPQRHCHRLLLTPAAAQAHESALAAAEKRAAGARRPAPEVVDRTDIERVAGDGTVHQGLAGLFDPLPDVALEDVLRAAGPAESPNVIVVLDQATDPQNVGAVLRSAGAMGAVAMALQDRHGPPASGALAKAASGALERVPLVRVTNLARALWQMKDAGFWCTGLDAEAREVLGQVALPSRLALVLGAEGAGLRRLTRETCDSLVRIPIGAEAESLNLSNAAAIALYEWRRTLAAS